MRKFKVRAAMFVMLAISAVAASSVMGGRHTNKRP